ncbi:hypothetical protein PRK78_005558 [Emydomyces testavorans]|uniref:DUF3074 domain-containing protein n=1 Tax=Emydomyces testavorans TaxID=2070801 RepID=A0AAF0IMQ5_9EURO|nr:hypothetical protein PRK78_005558 [Emydomyces testavorans]
MSSPNPPLPQDIFHPHPLPLTAIPYHPHHAPPISSSSPQHPDLTLFLTSALTHAHEWITTHMPWQIHHQARAANTHRARPSTARVEVCKRTAHRSPLKTQARGSLRASEEYWFGRRSVHEDAARSGTASLAELRRVLKDEHAEKEVVYNPAVVRAERVWEYDLSGVMSTAVGEGGGGGEWREVTACVNLITHKYPLCTTRCYTVLEITSTLPPLDPQSRTPEADPGFIIVQIPVSYPDLPNPKPTPPAATAIFANYVSIEMVRPLPRASSDTRSPQIEWTMATAGDAGGWIPESVQRSWWLGGVPKQIVKDVGFVLAYLAKQRTR